MKQITIKSALMRTVAVILLLIAGTVTSVAQYYMNVVQKDGKRVQYLVSNIDSLYFSGQEEPSTNCEYVDLGLSVNWATCNVGATKPEEYGDFFAWGETDPKNDYNWSNYKFRISGNSDDNVKFSKYNTNSSYGKVDNTTVLDPEDDVAHIKWGGSWRMPTWEEQEELLNNCTWKWYGRGNSEYGGVAGYKVTSNKEGYTDRSIFFPAAGYSDADGIGAIGSRGHYWYSSLSTVRVLYAWNLYFSSDGNHYTTYSHRLNGFSVRPVCLSETWWDNISVTIGQETATIHVGGTVSLTASVRKENDVISYPVKWTSDNPAIASVSADGVVTAKAVGQAKITATVQGKSATCIIEVTAAPYEYVDLGLSVKWATFNVGATKPEEYGDYFAWGETEPYYEDGYAQEATQSHWKDGKTAGYAWPSYKWLSGSSTKLTKYNTNRDFGTDDNKTTLDPDDDVAHVKWGGSWRMPTFEEQDELRNNCTWTWYSSGNSEFGGVAGYKVTSNIEGYTDRSIFLPAAGYRYYTDLNDVGSVGYYWSSSLYASIPISAWYIYFESGYLDAYYFYDRSFGQSVRPVCP